MARDLGGVRRLVEAAVGEADAEAAHRAAPRLLHRRDDGRAVDAARQERAERHVRLHPHRDRIVDQGLQRLGARPRIVPQKALPPPRPRARGADQ